MSQVLTPDYAKKLCKKSEPYELLTKKLLVHAKYRAWSDRISEQFAKEVSDKSLVASAPAHHPLTHRQITPISKIAMHGRLYPLQPGVVQDTVVDTSGISIAVRKKGFDGYQISRATGSISDVTAELHRRFDEDYLRVSRMIPVTRNEADRELWEMLTQLVDINGLEQRRSYSHEGKAQVIGVSRVGLTLRWYIEDEEFHIPSRMFASGGWDACKVGDWVRTAVTVRKHIGEVVNAMMLARIPEPKPMSERECEEFMNRPARHALPSADDEPI